HRTVCPAGGSGDLVSRYGRDRFGTGCTGSRDHGSEVEVTEASSTHGHGRNRLMTVLVDHPVGSWPSDLGGGVSPPQGTQAPVRELRARAGTIAGMVDVAPRRMSRLIGLERNGSVTDRGNRGSPAGRREAGTPPVGSNPAARGVRQPTAPPWWASVAAALLDGPVLIVSFPPYDLSWAAPVGVALLGAAMCRRGVWAGAGLGLLTGLVFLIPLLSWAGIVIGRVYLYLPVGEAGFFALLGAVTA